MRRAGLPLSIWGQNLAAGLILTVPCAFLLTSEGSRPRPVWRNVILLGALGLLLATFIDAGLEGVHRWVQVGPLRVHAGVVCLPTLLLALDATLRTPDAEYRGLVVLFIGTGASVLLALQPDAAQATAFAGALLTLLFLHRVPTPALVFAVPAAVAEVCWAWKCPDPLLPVRQVEGIVGLAAQNGILWQIGALLALAVLPLPFLLAGKSAHFPVARALGFYFGLCLLAPLAGAFPVPIMGFGLSPVIGYFIALGWLVAREGRAGN